jgi:hypothetical protein
VAVYRPDLKASGVIRPRPAALRAGAGQLLIPSDPTIAAIGRVSHITEATPGSVLPPGQRMRRPLIRLPPDREFWFAVGFAMHVLGLASGLALAIRPAGVAEVSGSRKPT